ncbi:uncharacterized protein AB9W97_006792 [Spinachia spinachia]
MRDEIYQYERQTSRCRTQHQWPLGRPGPGRRVSSCPPAQPPQKVDSTVPPARPPMPPSRPTPPCQKRCRITIMTSCGGDVLRSSMEIIRAHYQSRMHWDVVFELRQDHQSVSQRAIADAVERVVFTFRTGVAAVSRETHCPTRENPPHSRHGCKAVCPRLFDPTAATLHPLPGLSWAFSQHPFLISLSPVGYNDCEKHLIITYYPFGFIFSRIAQ